MRLKHLLVAVAASFALAAALTTVAIAAPGGEPGRPDLPGRSADAPGRQGDTAASQDTTNPDGTYRGKSPSRPDQDGIGMDRGIVNNDKTGPGTDGNNGCGNDPDREDDNNGWCGRKPEAAAVQPNALRPNGVASSGVRAGVARLAGFAGAEVLGQSFTRAASEVGGLAITGADVLRLALMAGAFVIVGFGIWGTATPKSP
jgi:hypothetical protein